MLACPSSPALLLNYPITAPAAASVTLSAACLWDCFVSRSCALCPTLGFPFLLTIPVFSPSARCSYQFRSHVLLPVSFPPPFFSRVCGVLRACACVRARVCAIACPQLQLSAFFALSYRTCVDTCTPRFCPQIDNQRSSHTGAGAKHQTNTKNKQIQTQKTNKHKHKNKAWAKQEWLLL